MNTNADDFFKKDFERYLSVAKNIVKDNDGNYVLEQYRFDSSDMYEHYSNHECNVCSHATCLGEKTTCEILDKLLGNKDVHTLTTIVVKCEAYDEIKKLNIISSFESLVAFMKRTENLFGCGTYFEHYYGFKKEREWDYETGDVLETTDEYVSKYGMDGFTDKIPKDYPCVIYFDYDDLFKYASGLDWISLDVLNSVKNGVK